MNPLLSRDEVHPITEGLAGREFFSLELAPGVQFGRRRNESHHGAKV
jgi:hypothetical protein